MWMKTEQSDFPGIWGKPSLWWRYWFAVCAVMFYLSTASALSDLIILLTTSSTLQSVMLLQRNHWNVGDLWSMWLADVNAVSFPHVAQPFYHHKPSDATNDNWSSTFKCICKTTLISVTASEDFKTCSGTKAFSLHSTWLNMKCLLACFMWTSR